MGIMDAGKICLFSNISDVITFDGKSAANALLVRTANLSRDRIVETRTDENGYFELSSVLKRTVTNFLPQEFVARQVIEVDYNDQKYDIWSGVKRSPEESSEARGGGVRGQLRVDQREVFKTGQ